MASKTKRLGLLGVIVWALSAVSLRAQSSGLPATADAVIEQMATAAAVIFAGQVTAVRLPTGFAASGEGGSPGIVEVDFQVDQAVIGPAAGSVYTLREWAGLWSGNRRCYRVGQRLLMFLRAPDAEGLSSPVHGRDGAVPLRGGGVAPGPGDTATAASGWMADLRWVQAQALRSGAALTMPARRPVHGPVHGIVSEDSRLEAPERVLRAPVLQPQSAAAAVEAETLSQVLGLCQQAMRGSDAAR